MPGVHNPGEGHVFRSQAFIDAEATRAKLADAQAAAQAAQLVVDGHTAELIRLGLLEQDRLLDVKQKELRSRVQAGRARISAAVKIAAQLELDISAMQAKWAALHVELEGFRALLPEGTTVDRIETANLHTLLAHALYAAAVDETPPFLGQRLSSTEPAFSDAIEAAGRHAVDVLWGALGVINKGQSE